MIRARLALVLAILVPLSTGAAGGAPSIQVAETVRADGTARPKADRGAPRTALGVQFHGTWSDYDRRERGVVLDRIRESGATWVRLDVGWSMLQPDRGRFDHDWAVPFVDQVIRQVNRRGLKLLVMFWQTPDWATDADTDRAAPSDPADYARAIGWAANRWQDQVSAWEVWNEPNYDNFLAGADPTTYTELLCHAYEAVHSNDPTARVVFGGTMYNDDAWIRRAYRAGAGECFDVMATHPYMGQADAPPETPADGHIYTLRHVRAVRSVMREFGDQRPIWATEFGWSSHDNAGDEGPWDLGVTEGVQARYAVRALRLFRQDYPYVRKAFWYTDRDKDSGDVHQDGYGMLRRDLSPKPVYWALRRYLT